MSDDTSSGSSDLGSNQSETSITPQKGAEVETSTEESIDEAEPAPKKQKTEPQKDVTSNAPNNLKRKIEEENKSPASDNKKPRQAGTRFQRVDPTKTQFSNKKLADNSYKANAHLYGKKAAETLGKVKGDRFRHEKTKKEERI
jgi:hypothetical protein